MTPTDLETLRGLQKKLAGLKMEAKLYGSPFPDSKRQVAEDAYASYEALTVLLADYERYERALNQIASWQEGETVTSMFDDPGSARIARGALRATLEEGEHEQD